MIKIIINSRYGGFSFSEDFLSEWKALGGQAISRVCPIAITLLEQRGSLWASGPGASLAIVTVPADVLVVNGGRGWCVLDHDGLETVAENHRTWGAS